MAGNVSTPGASVTSRALALLGAFDDEHRSLSLSGSPSGPSCRCRRRTGSSASWSPGAR